MEWKGVRVQGEVGNLVMVLAGHWYPFDLGHAPISLGSQQPPLKCERFGLANLGGASLL